MSTKTEVKDVRISPLDNAVAYATAQRLDYKISHGENTSRITVDAKETDSGALDVVFIGEFLKRGCFVVSITKPSRKESMKVTFVCGNE